MTPSTGTDRRLVRRYRCEPTAVELIAVGPSDRPLRRRQPKTKSQLARIRDVSVTGFRVEMLVEPRVPAGGWLEVSWEGARARVEVRHRERDEESGLVELGLFVVDGDETFRDKLYQLVATARGRSRNLEATWRSAR